MAITEAEKKELTEWFYASYHTVQLMRVWVDEETHAVNVKAHAIKPKFKTNIPFKMGLVTGNYEAHACELESLHNAPHTVMGSFLCQNNYLTSLEGGPKSVGSALPDGGTYNCSHNLLSNFEHAPTDFSGHFLGTEQMGKGLTSVDGIPLDSSYVTMSAPPNLPLLKLTQHKHTLHVSLRYPHVGGENKKLTEIFDTHAGQGKAGALKAAVAMIKAGFTGNARW